MTNLDQFYKTLLLRGCVHVPFDNTTVTSMDEFIASAAGKIFIKSEGNVVSVGCSVVAQVPLHNLSNLCMLSNIYLHIYLYIILL